MLSACWMKVWIQARHTENWISSSQFCQLKLEFFLRRSFQKRERNDSQCAWSTTFGEWKLKSLSSKIISILSASESFNNDLPVERVDNPNDVWRYKTTRAHVVLKEKKNLFDSLELFNWEQIGSWWKILSTQCQIQMNGLIITC